MNLRKLQRVIEFTLWILFIVAMITVNSIKVASINILLLKTVLWILAISCAILSIKLHNSDNFLFYIKGGDFKKLLFQIIINLGLLGLFVLFLFAVPTNNIIIASLLILISGLINGSMVKKKYLKNYLKKSFYFSIIMAIFFEMVFIYYFLSTKEFYCENCSLTGVLFFIFIVFITIFMLYFVGNVTSWIMNSFLHER